MKLISLSIFLLHFSIAISQIGNDQMVLQRNQVKTSVESHCFENSQGSCTVIFEKYDRKGNTIEWNFGRLGSKYRYEYDERNNQTLNLWISKQDTTEIDSLRYHYNEHNDLIKEDFPGYQANYIHTYNDQNLLTKTVKEVINDDLSISQTVTTYEYNESNQILSTFERSTESQSVTGKVSNHLYHHRNVRLYDENQRLVNNIFYDRDTLNRTVNFVYDSIGRVIQETDHDFNRMERLNRHKMSNRGDIESFVTSTSYNDKGQILELYTYFSDPCMSLDNHFLFKHHYLENGLIDYADVFENENLIYTISFEYEYYP